MDRNPATNEPVYERLAYEAALRALDKQERLIDELRNRTGLLLAAASLAASFLGREAFAGHPKRGLAILALVASCLRSGPACTCSCRRPASSSLRWSVPDSTRGCTNSRTTFGEVYRRLAYDLDRFWDDNDVELQKLFSGVSSCRGGAISRDSHPDSHGERYPVLRDGW